MALSMQLAEFPDQVRQWRPGGDPRPELYRAGRTGFLLQQTLKPIDSRKLEFAQILDGH
jgi:hypothetical protein